MVVSSSFVSDFVVAKSDTTVFRVSSIHITSYRGDWNAILWQREINRNLNTTQNCQSSTTVLFRFTLTQIVKLHEPLTLTYTENLKPKFATQCINFFDTMQHKSIQQNSFTYLHQPRTTKAKWRGYIAFYNHSQGIFQYNIFLLSETNNFGETIF